MVKITTAQTHKVVFSPELEGALEKMVASFEASPQVQEIGFSPVIEGTLMRIAIAFENLARYGEWIMSALDRLEAAVKRNVDAEDSVLTLLTGIVSELNKYKGLDSRLDEFSSSLENRADTLSRIVVENTVAAPAPEPVPAPVEPAPVVEMPAAPIDTAPTV
jgi:hypothetical protein